MKSIEAEKLLGGYATGTLTEVERQTLFTAALDHQEIFDALVDEEALRDLLSDPVAKARLFAALSTGTPSKVIPFWRRTGVLGAAAGLIVAATAGLAYLHSPDKAPLPLQEEVAKEPEAKAVVAPFVALPTPAQALKVTPAAPPKEATRFKRAVEVAAPPPPAPSQQLSNAQAAGAAVTNLEDAYRARTQVEAESRRMEAQDQVAKKAEAPRPAAAVVMEVAGSMAPAPLAPPPAKAMAKARASGGARQDAAATITVPTWTLEAQPDGSTRVTVTAPRGAQVVLLRRAAAGAAVLKVRTTDDQGSSRVQWRTEVRLAPDDALDLYLLNTPVADPILLPETGPVDGFRARIHPAAK